MIRINPDLRESDFFKLAPQLLIIVADVASYCLVRYNYYITITSMLRKKTSDSGVHETGRAIDISVKELDAEEIADIVNYINLNYERTDNKPTALFHNVGQGDHIHIGVQYSKSFEGQERANINFCQTITKH